MPHDKRGKKLFGRVVSRCMYQLLKEIDGEPAVPRKRNLSPGNLEVRNPLDEAGGLCQRMVERQRHEKLRRRSWRDDSLLIVGLVALCDLLVFRLTRPLGDRPAVN